MEASSFTRASSWKPITPMLDEITACTRPASTSFTASPVDLVGMCVICSPAFARNDAIARCVALPLPAEA
ncbi:hypothetical protein D9M69_669800 [compost metagenome]